MHGQGLNSKMQLPQLPTTEFHQVAFIVLTMTP